MLSPMTLEVEPVDEPVDEPVLTADEQIHDPDVEDRVT